MPLTSDPNPAKPKPPARRLLTAKTVFRTSSLASEASPEAASAAAELESSKSASAAGSSAAFKAFCCASEVDSEGAASEGV
ncbi:unnamed protein product [Closterium sp. NIES-54]